MFLRIELDDSDMVLGAVTDAKRVADQLNCNVKVKVDGEWLYLWANAPMDIPGAIQAHREMAKRLRAAAL